MIKLKKKLLNLNNEIIEEGINADGSYTKYADGTMICEKTITFSNITTTTTFGQMYRSSPIDCGNYAMPFINLPRVWMNHYSTSAILGSRYGSHSSTKFNGYVVYNINNTAQVAGNIDAIAKGRWKI